MSVSIDDADVYWQAITIIEAQEQLKLLSAADWPKTGKNSREKIHRQLHRDAYPASFKTAKQVTAVDLAKILSGGS